MSATYPRTGDPIIGCADCTAVGILREVKPGELTMTVIHPITCPTYLKIAALLDKECA